jgi:hypothetical protein
MEGMYLLGMFVTWNQNVFARKNVVYMLIMGKSCLINIKKGVGM